MSGNLRLPAPPAQYSQRDQTEMRRSIAAFLESVQGLRGITIGPTAFTALTYSGLTTGHALVASGAAAAGFRALLAADIGAGTFGTGDFFFQSRVQVGSLPTVGAGLLANFAAARLLSGRTTVGGSEYLGFAYADHARMILGRANGTPAAPTGPLNGEVLGSLYFGGHDASSIFAGAEVEGLAEEDFVSGACGSRLRLRTVPIGSTTLVERFTVRASGHLEPGVDDTYNIGDVALRIKDLYATTLHGALSAAEVTVGSFPGGAFIFPGPRISVGDIAAGSGIQMTTDGGSGSTINYALYIGGVARAFLGAAAAANDSITGTAVNDMFFRTQGSSILFSVDSGSSPAVTLTSSGALIVGTDPGGSEKLRAETLQVGGTGNGTYLRVSDVFAFTKGGAGVADLQIKVSNGALRFINSPYTVALVTINDDQGGGDGSVSVTNQLKTGASTTARASARLPHGTAPTTPVDGDMWTTTAGLFVRINGSTVGPLS